ncbi:hypothetical protein [Lactobacillus crispatus]|jgi:hypothetical protein|uniref:Uncharacterized protein n=1 Tax=Lactobacillus crispatus TaxID=47770 RepID=A0A135ZGK9_9LACO|nr:hypothetical protein [Lactobacillus crispatus]KWU07201.1 hypothetical protein AEL98_11990 [Lactobacillus crispatus]KWU14655.1 hypothetical protein AEM00_06450 [Lactobacillus crispatus]KXI20827.1 hypothetical protein HMPREF3209_00078 [Lactobacillus crispatus]MCT7696490.1 hypothetical protein [Lactobacillus crispatus]MCT7707941.1 hypothetical protein [Lactobacillus crispatus]
MSQDEKLNINELLTYPEVGKDKAISPNTKFYVLKKQDNGEYEVSGVYVFQLPKKKDFKEESKSFKDIFEHAYYIVSDFEEPDSHSNLLTMQGFLDFIHNYTQSGYKVVFSPNQLSQNQFWGL